MRELATEYSRVLVPDAWSSSSSSRIFPRGTSKVYLAPDRQELGLGTRPEDRVRNNQVIDRNRRRGHLEGEFMCTEERSPGTTQLYYAASLPEGRVSFIGQPAGYSEVSGLIVATEMPAIPPAELLNRETELVPTRFPADLPFATRLAYTGAKLAALQVAFGTATEVQKSVVIEHLTPDIKTDEIKYPRSVPWVHASVLNIDLESIDPDNRKAIPHLEAEQNILGSEYNALLSLYMLTAINLILEETRFASNREGIDVRPRFVEPHGYGIVFDIPPETMTDPANVLFVTSVLDAEHQALQTIEDTQLWQRLPNIIRDASGTVLSRKPQPATRGYLHVNEEGLLEKVTSKIVYSHAGGIEAAGVVLMRGPEHPQRHDPEKVVLFRELIGAKVGSTISNLDFAA